MPEDLFSDVPARVRLQRNQTGRVTDPSRQSFLDQLMAEGTRLLRPRPPVTLEPGRGVVDGRWEVGVAASRWHHPRTVRMCGFDPRDTAFWVNLVIGCEGPAAGAPGNAAAARPLVNALRDLYALRSFYQPAAIGTADIVLPGSVGRSAGFFSHTIWLANPDRARLHEAFDSIGHWLAINGDDPEFADFQVNTFFSGHGTGGARPGDSGICLRDGVHPTEALVDAMIGRLARHDIRAARCQATLFLDCCHAAAVGRDFVGSLLGLASQPRRVNGIGEIAMHLLMVSSLHDESSFDMPRAGANSFFVAGYLRENSARATPRDYRPMAEIPLRTDRRQHPLLLRFEEDGVQLRFPALDLLDAEDKASARAEPAIGDGFAAALRALGWAEVSGAPGRIEPLLAQAAVLRERVRTGRTNRRATVVPFAERRVRWDI